MNIFFSSPFVTPKIPGRVQPKSLFGKVLAEGSEEAGVALLHEVRTEIIFYYLKDVRHLVI
jgi:hypothetical protein